MTGRATPKQGDEVIISNTGNTNEVADEIDDEIPDGKANTDEVPDEVPNAEANTGQQGRTPIGNSQ